MVVVRAVFGVFQRGIVAEPFCDLVERLFAFKACKQCLRGFLKVRFILAYFGIKILQSGKAVAVLFFRRKQFCQIPRIGLRNLGTSWDRSRHKNLQALGCAASYAFFRRSTVTWVYICVVDRFAWPSSVCTLRRSAPLSSRCVAKLWRSLCGLARNWMDV